ncbi:MAG: hypothetical protein M3Z84_09445 [Actinomycetota bacterium]|nr:hypothetical protein [Actinomycetota bacterium]
MLRSIARLALRKGLFGGSRGWLVVGVGATGLRVFAKAARRKPEVVYRETLDTGHSLVISHLGRDRG